MEDARPLNPPELYRRCDPGQFRFTTTAELQPVSQLTLQPRATQALRFGLGIQQPGFNLFVLGQPGAGRHRAAMQCIVEQAGDEAPGPDLCAVHNFEDPYSPRWVQLPAGRAAAFVEALEEVVEAIGTLIPAAFAADEYENRLQEIEERRIEQQDEALHGLENDAREAGIELLRTPAGFTFAPVREGQVLQGDALEQLPLDERTLIEESLRRYESRLAELLAETAQWRRLAHQEKEALDREVGAHALEPAYQRLADRFADEPDVAWFLDEVREDVLRQLPRLRRELATQSDLYAWRDDPESLAARYRVNPIVQQDPAGGSPWEYLARPTFESLFGWTEYRVSQGALVGELSLLRAGALQRCNGGYLLLDAEPLLNDNDLWTAVKQMLATGELRWDRTINDGERAVRMTPRPLPVHVRLVLVGSRSHYYQLMDQDPDFPRLFKVAADFEDRILRDSEAETRYAALLATLGRQEGLLPLTAEGVARMVEEGARLVGDAERLTTNLGRLADILREADYWARRDDKEAIYLGDVERALQEQEYRLGRVPERFREEILRNVVAISTEGSRIAQVNGISVVEVGDMAFGLPSRITATAWLGEGEIIDIEREVELGGALHSKGVLILSQFLGARYARTRPLSVTASLVFEQSYGPLDGDSASLGELCALLSALAEIPMAQHLAVSGSVNQLGEVQAIGSVNEKVEGFFAICNARGLSGNQGMILPRTNLVNLMLRRDVVRAVTEGRFHLYAVDHVDQAMSLLAGMPAGEADAEGNFPEDSVNGRVTARLVHLAELRKDDGEKKHRGRSEHEHP